MNLKRHPDDLQLFPLMCIKLILGHMSRHDFIDQDYYQLCLFDNWTADQENSLVQGRCHISPVRYTGKS